MDVGVGTSNPKKYANKVGRLTRTQNYTNHFHITLHKYSSLYFVLSTYIWKCFFYYSCFHCLFFVEWWIICEYCL